ncbi:MAG: hypothetical protein KDA91_24450 [Planctomycetaceae bacterium]|nr:hypothetical protein [Planctomycetaceae bacterium]
MIRDFRTWLTVPLLTIITLYISGCGTEGSTNGPDGNQSTSVDTNAAAAKPPVVRESSPASAQRSIPVSIPGWAITPELRQKLAKRDSRGLPGGFVDAESNQYINLAHGFKIQLSDSVALISAESGESFDPGLTIAVRDTRLGTQLRVNSEKLSELDAGKIIRSNGASKRDGFTIDRSFPEITTEFLGSSVAFVSGVDATGHPKLRAATYRGSRLFNLDIHPTEGTDEVTLPENLLRAFQAMSDDEMAAAVDAHPELLLAPDAVGAHSSVRDGVYRNFETGVIWRIPDGYWQLLDGPRGQYGKADSMLIRELKENVLLLLTIIPNHGAVGEAGAQNWHSDALTAIKRAGQLVQNGDRREINGVEFLATTAKVIENDVPFEFAVLTATPSGHAIRIQIWSPNIEAETGRSDRMLQHFYLAPGQISESRVTASGAWIDNRFGFQFDAPSTSRLAYDALGLYAGFSTQITHDGGDERISVGAFLPTMFTMPSTIPRVESPSTEQALSELIDASAIDDADVSEVIDCTFVGLPGKIHKWSSKNETTVFAYAVHDLKLFHMTINCSDHSPEGIESHLDRMTLLNQ